ncbi:hypothetical protein MNBD_GAMMA11-2910 [hydrothermal vent metagenome]|uniref:Uncharacterized protein n=1 Tax=hydrothermal vent metagenome TaxID=652676 RepID=A0A3B0X9C7_9ZZZZ
MENVIIDHRMLNNDRRSWKADTAFPLMDSEGVLVSEDRRVLPERRGYNIEMVSFEEIELEVLKVAPSRKLTPPL